MSNLTRHMPHLNRAARADGSRLLLTTHWRSYEAVVSVNVNSKGVSRVTPDDGASWLLLSVCSGARVRPCKVACCFRQW